MWLQESKRNFSSKSKYGIISPPNINSYVFAFFLKKSFESCFRWIALSENMVYNVTSTIKQKKYPRQVQSDTVFKISQKSLLILEDSNHT